MTAAVRLYDNPFTIVIDTREQRPYSFVGLRANADRGGVPMNIPTIRECIPVGDYSIAGFPRITVERKSKEDLYGSVVRRKNFEDRLERMNALDHAAVVVEATIAQLIKQPPTFTRYAPKALVRTIIAWTQRYPRVHWWFAEDRTQAEGLTFRILERYWLDRQAEQGVTT